MLRLCKTTTKEMVIAMLTLTSCDRGVETINAIDGTDSAAE